MISSAIRLLLPDSIRKRMAAIILAGLPLIAWATPTLDQIEAEVEEFQRFFQARFPGVVVESYSAGVAALPQFNQQRQERELLMDFPPYETAINEAKILWNTPLVSGVTLQQCFAGKPPPTAYPYFFNGEVHTIAGDINRCLTDNSEPALDPAGSQMATMVAAYKHPFREQPVDIDYRPLEIRNMYEKGRHYFWSKRGQMNLSCANCHVHNAGNKLRGDVLSAALGHGNGYPAYSIASHGSDTQTGVERASSSMRTLHHRYALCNRMVGAVPLPAQSETYVALELYQMILNNRLPLNAPGIRQ